MINRDFTLHKFRQLLVECKNAGYGFLTFEDFICCENLSEKVIILRHDIDHSPQNALLMAKLECEFEVRDSYCFRIVKKSLNVKIIPEIAELGHEIGYHYEDLCLCRGNYEFE